jgi:hypothetical protein
MQNPIALVKVVADLLPEEKQLTIADPLLDAINRLAASRNRSRSQSIGPLGAPLIGRDHPVAPLRRPARR